MEKENKEALREKLASIYKDNHYQDETSKTVPDGDLEVSTRLSASQTQDTALDRAVAAEVFPKEHQDIALGEFQNTKIEPTQQLSVLPESPKEKINAPMKINRGQLHQEIPQEITTDNFADGDSQSNQEYPPNIYDILLRIMFIYQGEWLLLIKEGVFHGILTKKYLLAQLSEIAKLSDPLSLHIQPKEAIIPNLQEILHIFAYQKQFPLVDTQGNIIEVVSRSLCLDLMERLQTEGGGFPLLSSPLWAHRDSDDQILLEQQPKANGQIDWFMSILLESIPLGLLAVDRKNRVIFYNERFKQLILAQQAKKTSAKRKKQEKQVLETEIFENLGEKVAAAISALGIDANSKASELASKKIVVSDFHVLLTASPLQSNRSRIGLLFLAKALTVK